MSAVFIFLSAFPWLFLAGQVIDQEILLAYTCYAFAFVLVVVESLQLGHDNDVGGLVRRMRSRGK